MLRYILLSIVAVTLIAAVADGGLVDGYAYLESQSDHSGTRVYYQNNIAPSQHECTYTNSSGYYQFDWIFTGLCDFTFTHAGYDTVTLENVYIPPLIPKRLIDVYLPEVQFRLCGDWAQPLYQPGGTDIEFPHDEGKHYPWLTNPMEWWYVNFHLTGSVTGVEYGAVVVFFKFPAMRIFAISDLTQEQIYTRRRFGPLIAATSKLGLTFWHPGIPGGLNSTGNPGEPLIGENLQPFVPDTVSFRPSNEIQQLREPSLIGLPSICDRFYNKESNGQLIPFEYHLSVWDRAREDLNPMKLEVDMISLKKPMIVDGDGEIDICNGTSKYYCHTNVSVTGTIEVHGVTEPVTGTAWIDHQWGNFLIGDNATWEWFSIKLDDNREIMVADLWCDGVPQGSYSNGLHYYDEECELHICDEYSIVREDFWTDPSGRVFATRWTISEQSQDIDIVVIADFEEQAISLTDDHIFRIPFWEGSCTVTGTIGNQQVTGKAYAELTHSWEPPIYPITGSPHGIAQQSEILSIYPNPGNPEMEITYFLSEAENVTLQVYNLLGQKVAKLVNGVQSAGTHSVRFNGANLTSGVYFLRFETLDMINTRKIMILK